MDALEAILGRRSVPQFQRAPRGKGEAADLLRAAMAAPPPGHEAGGFFVVTGLKTWKPGRTASLRRHDRRGRGAWVV